jgi:hypothetical protein
MYSNVYSEASRNIKLRLYAIINIFLLLLQFLTTLKSESMFGAIVTIFVIVNPLKLSCNYLYHLLNNNNNKLCTLYTEYIYGFHAILAINSDYFLKQR